MRNLRLMNGTESLEIILQLYRREGERNVDGCYRRRKKCQLCAGR